MHQRLKLLASITHITTLCCVAFIGVCRTMADEPPEPVLQSEASATGAEDESDQQAIARWVNRLGAAKFRDRSEATTQLIAAGPAAVAQVAAAAKLKDDEASTRALYILSQMAANVSTASSDSQSIAAMRRLVNSEDPVLAARSRRVFQDALNTRRDMAVLRLKKLGARVSQRNSIVNNVYISKDWRGGNGGLAHLQWFSQMETLSLTDSSVSDDGLVYVGKLKGLKSLFLSGSQVQGEGLKHLQQLPALEFLSMKSLPLRAGTLEAIHDITTMKRLGLDYTPINDEGLQHIAAMTRLETLWLNYTKVTDQGLKHLKDMQSLSKLILTACNVNGPGIASLEELQGLRYLSVQFAPVDDTAMPYFGKLTQIETLGLDDTKVTDKGLESLSGLTTLHTLWLTNTAITDEGLLKLTKLTGLRKLYVRGSKVTAKGAAEFKRRAPQCVVVR